MDVAENEVDLNLSSVIGFSGNVPQGLQHTPCGQYVVYPLGSNIVVRNIALNRQSFLRGHNNRVSCLSVSHDGTKLASGQVNQAGVKADVFVWDLEQAKRNCDDGIPCAGGEEIFRLRQHLGKVQDVDFSCDDQYLVTLGGQDDNAVVIWNVETGIPICGSPAAQDSALSARWLNNRNDRLVTCGNYHLRVWQVDVDTPRMHAMDAKMGSMRRVIQCISVDPSDQYAFCGTKTGDLLQFAIDRDPIQSFNDPDKVRPLVKGVSNERFSKGIKCVTALKNPDTGNTNVLIGAGDGTIAILNPTLNVVRGRRTEVMGAATSISLNPEKDGFYVGTDQANTYFVGLDMNVELRGTCHYGRVTDVQFPSNCSDIFVTSSVNDIRIWNARLRQELLRIQVPNLECNCIGITPNGGSIVSGWTDGKIRAFYPESGRLKFVITDAHTESVTSLAVCNDDDNLPPWRVVSGGQDGRVRVWSITSSHQTLVRSMKEHRGPVNCIKVARDNSQAISASADGSCIVWDLERYVRINAMFEPNVFRSLLYHPDESQILTCGSNHKISYWDAYDGNAIRIIDGGEEEMEALDIEPDGVVFVSGGGDKTVRVWNYDEGICTATGHGHSGSVMSVAISPDQQNIVSCGSEGSIFIWEMPAEGAADLKAEGYVPKADVADEIDDDPAEAKEAYDEKYDDEEK